MSAPTTATLGPRRRRWMAALAPAVLDTGSILAAYMWAVYQVLPWSLTLDEAGIEYCPYLIIFLLFWYSSAADRRLFGMGAGGELATYLFAVLKALADALICSTVVMALATREGVSRDFLVAFCMSMPVALLGTRLAVRLALAVVHRRGHGLTRVLIVGANARAVHLVETLRATGFGQYRIEGFLEDDAARVPTLEACQTARWGRVEEFPQVIQSHPVDEVYVCLPVRSCYEAIRTVAQQCEETGLPMRLVADLFPLRIATSRLMYVGDIPLISLSAIPETQFRLAIKRAVDLFVSSALLIGLAPVFLALAILIKLDTPGPIFFAQERVGQNQRRFKILKFRSMVVNAESLRQELEALNEADGPVFKIRSDPRVTRVGKYLRKLSLDEFPQLVNVWVGHMSLVGPRPPIPSEVEQYTWDQRRRLSVRPGMTGLWQVSGRSDISFEQWVEMDLAYIDSWSLWLDAVILFKTFGAVVHGRGAA